MMTKTERNTFANAIKKEVLEAVSYQVQRTYEYLLMTSEDDKIPAAFWDLSINLREAFTELEDQE